MGKKKTVILVGVVVLAVAAVAVYYFFYRPSQPQEQTESTLPEKSITTGDQEGEEHIEPIEVDLNKSDELVRKLLGELSAHPTLAQWLTTDYLIRRFVAAVDLIAKGSTPETLPWQQAQKEN